jgi:SOS-response transcriptional repressor LexA
VDQPNGAQAKRRRDDNGSGYCVDRHGFLLAPVSVTVILNFRTCKPDPKILFRFSEFFVLTISVMSARMDIEWIVEGLKKPGKTQAGIAKAMRRSPSMVTAMLKGKRELKARDIAVIARYLEVDPPSAPPIDPRPQIRTAMIIGDVAGGVWTEPGVEFEPIPTTVVIDERWGASDVFLLRVRGSSINRQAKDGDLVLCLNKYAAPRDIRSGDWVIVERKTSDGRMETTVKRVQGDMKRGFFLVPDSDDPQFQAPILIGKTDGEVVEVRAFVLEFIKRGTTF